MHLYSHLSSPTDKRQVEIDKMKNNRVDDVDVLVLIKVNFNHN